MSTDTKPERKFNGLSPSSLSLFQQCQRKYYHKKIAKFPIDPDAAEDTESLRVGKAFHRCLELTRHNLNGYRMGQAKEVVIEHGLNEAFHLPLIFSMLSKYKEVHEKSKLEVLACEHIIDTPLFYGILDVVLLDKDEYWWIGDMKTAANFSQTLIPTLPSHQQLNLYAAHARDVADALGLDVSKFAGTRYRLTTKSRLNRKAGEDTAAFFARLGGSIKSFDFPIPAVKMCPDVATLEHLRIKNHIDSTTDILSYACNFGSCQAYYRPCEFWSRCHGSTFTEMGDLKNAIVSQ